MVLAQLGCGIFATHALVGAMEACGPSTICCRSSLHLLPAAWTMLPSLRVIRRAFDCCQALWGRMGGMKEAPSQCPFGFPVLWLQQVRDLCHMG